MNNNKELSPLVNEFKQIYNAEASGEKKRINPNTDAIIVLSGHAVYDKDGAPITWVSPENIVRIGFAIQVIRDIIAKRLKKDEVTNKDIKNSNLKLFLNGESNQQKDILKTQLDDMKHIAQAYNFPGDNIVLEDCLENGEANTKTQFKSINLDPSLKEASHITIITSDYHVPRVRRTAVKNLRSDISFDVLPTPQLEYDSYNVYPKVMGEIKRIIKYSNKGDISKVPTRE